jgi:hypothetical protein
VTTYQQVVTETYLGKDVIRPKTQLGYDLRARRRNGDWGLGAAARHKTEADIFINKHYPIWAGT